MKKLTLLTGVFLLAGGAANAVSLSFQAGSGTALAFGTSGSNYTAGPCDSDPASCYNPNGAAAGLTEDLLTFDGSPGNTTPGLLLDQKAALTVTFLGKEAQAKAFAFSLGDEISNADANLGKSYTTIVSGGTLDFAFRSLVNGGTLAANDGTFSGDAAIGFSQLYDGGKTVYAFFDDSGANLDRDFDDMVVKITVANLTRTLTGVPLPAGAILLGTALAGFGVSRRRRKAA